MIPRSDQGLHGLLFCALLLLHLLCDDVGAAPPDAVVRIPSHGCSGTIIATGPGESWVLTCAHAFAGRARSKPLTIDVPSPSGGRTSGSRAKPEIVRLDEQGDLCLIRLPAGPLDYFAPVAESAPGVGEIVEAVGYEEMRKPAYRMRTRIVGEGDHFTLTSERPIPGMSGGPLLAGGSVVGTCTGYESTRYGRGLFVRLYVVRGFLGFELRVPRGGFARPYPRYAPAPFGWR
jgi:hypothetical protein